MTPKKPVPLHEELSWPIIGRAFEVINEFAIGLLESVQEKAMALALLDAGLKVNPQAPIPVTYSGKIGEEFHADLLAEEEAVIKLKAQKALSPDHQAQTINHLNRTAPETANIREGKAHAQV